jgi:hypothetical protein
MSSRAAIAFALALLASSSARAGVSSTELIERGKEYDGREVEFVGEAIGDAMARGEHVWVNVSDGSNSALGVWAAESAWPALRFYGAAEARGDVVRVRGIFSRACAEHGGDMDIHATSVVVLTPGAPTPHEVSLRRMVAAAVLLAASPVLFLLWKRREKRLSEAATRPSSDSRRPAR